MKTVLFQGDSITDASRDREIDFHEMGSGYANMVTGKLSLTYPNKIKCYNRGISGHRVVDLYARWKADCINLAPDYLSILIGVNDVSAELWCKDGVEAERFERILDMMLRETKAALPNCKIMLLEPYVMSGSATREHWNYFEKEVPLRGEAVRRIALKYELPFIPLQQIFEDATKIAPSEFWLADGVHPTTAGHALIAQHWLSAAKEHFGL